MKMSAHGPILGRNWLEKGKKKRQKRICWYCVSMLGFCNPLTLKCITVRFAVCGTHSPPSQNILFVLFVVVVCVLLCFIEPMVRESRARCDSNAPGALNRIYASPL